MRIQVGRVGPDNEVTWLDGYIEIADMPSTVSAQGAHTELVDEWGGGGEGEYSAPAQEVTGRIVAGVLAGTRSLTHRKI